MAILIELETGFLCCATGRIIHLNNMLQEVYYSPNKIYKCNTRTTVAFVAFTTKNKQCETDGL